jgi:subtilase family serine protease
MTMRRWSGLRGGAHVCDIIRCTHMRTTFRFASTAISVVVTAALAPAASAAQIANNVAPWLSEATLTGHSNPNGRVVVNMYLQLRNESALQSLVGNLYTPGNPQYRQFLTPDQFRAGYSPAAADLNAVKNFLSQKGLKVEYAPANGLYVDASGTVSQIESAFAVTENQYDYLGMNLRANAQAPTIPASLASVVTYVGGLDESYALVQPHIRKDAPNSSPGFGYSTPPPCSTFWADHSATASPAAYQYGSTLPWTPCGYVPSQIRAAYGIDRVAQTGKGVRVGITDAFASPTIVSDVNLFATNHGLPLLNSTNFQQIVVPGTLNYPENRFDPRGWYGEESLDIEWVHSLAPDATIIYAGAQNSTQPLDHALIHLIDNHLADIITNSWGAIGDLQNYGHVQADERAFLQAAAEGITVLFSSGDDGDVAALTGLAQGSWPATSSLVTAVGGTSLELKDASGAKDEYGWGSYTSSLTGGTVSPDGKQVTGTAWTAWPPAFLYGSGGGLSLNFLQPDYQQGVVPSALATSTVDVNGNVIPVSPARRVVPDISMNADPNTGSLYGQSYNISGDPLIDAGCTPLSKTLEYCERRVGGTSLSSPSFAGVLALANQARFDLGKAPLGFVNPALYSIATAPHSIAIVDVRPPTSPQALLRNFQLGTGIETRVRTVNSVPPDTTGTVVEGADTSLRTTAGWDNVTGLGTPNVPALIPVLRDLQ